MFTNLSIFTLFWHYIYFFSCSYTALISPRPLSSSLIYILCGATPQGYLPSHRIRFCDSIMPFKQSNWWCDVALCCTCENYQCQKNPNDMGYDAALHELIWVISPFSAGYHLFGLRCCCVAMSSGAYSDQSGQNIKLLTNLRCPSCVLLASRGTGEANGGFAGYHKHWCGALATAALSRCWRNYFPRVCKPKRGFLRSEDCRIVFRFPMLSYFDIFEADPRVKTLYSPRLLYV